MILDHPNCFGRIQIVLVRFKLYFSRLIFIIWTCPKWFEPKPEQIGPVQNNWLNQTKMTVQNHFEPIEGQGIKGQ